MVSINIILTTKTKRSTNMNDSIFEKLWTDDKDKKYTLRGTVPVPVGLKNCRCPKCNSMNISGALITETADEQDPNIICLDCGYWWD